MRTIGNNASVDVSSIEEAMQVYNTDMEIIRELFNKIITVSNRQNRRIFWLSIIGLGMAGSLYTLGNKYVELEEKFDNYISRNADIEEK